MSGHAATSIDAIMTTTTPSSIQFTSFTLDLDRLCLSGPLGRINLRPKTFEVLCFLVGNAGRVVTRQEVLNTVWPGVTVTDESLTVCVSEIRRALDDKNHEIVRTVARRGYLFDVSTSAGQLTATQASEAKNAGAADHASSSARPVIDQPDIGSLVAISSTSPSRRLERMALPDWWRRSLLGFQRQDLRLWGAAAALLSIALAGTYLIGRSLTPAGTSMHVGPAATAPVPLKPRPVFRDCNVCPEMVSLPAGEFMMGSPEDDDLRMQVEGPPRRVAIARPFAIGRFEVTVDQFAAFVTETGTTVNKPFNECRVTIGFNLDPPYLTGSPDASFRRPGFEVTGAHPAGCISWYDAQSYLAWLRRKTGRAYRLPTEVEWEYAARAGTTARYSFGNDERLLCDHARFADLASRYARGDGCRSEIRTDGPIEVGRLKPNAWGIFDVHGNVSEWVEDCWTSNWSEIPTDGSAFARPANCEMGVIRGGSWLASSRWARTAVRIARRTSTQFQYTGFRVALTLDPPR